MSCCSARFTSSVSPASPPSPYSTGNGLSALQTYQVSSHLGTTWNDLPKIFPWLPPSPHSALNLYHLREGQKTLLEALPICPFRGCAFIPQVLWVLAAPGPGLCPFMWNCPWLAGASLPGRLPLPKASSQSLIRGEPFHSCVQSPPIPADTHTYTYTHTHPL